MGLFRPKVHSAHGMAQPNCTGMFPWEIMNRIRLLLLEEEGRLNDMGLREKFIEWVFAYGGKPGFPFGSFPQHVAGNCTAAWIRMLDEKPTPGGPQPEALHRGGPPRRRRREAGTG